MSEETKDNWAVLGENARHARYNHVAGVTAGMFAGTARDFLHPELILAGLMYSLTGSEYLVALVTIINKSGILFSQLPASTLIEHAPRRKPYFVLITIIRILAFAGVTAAMWLVTLDTNGSTLALFFAAYTVGCFSTGTGAVIFMDMIGRLIPAHRVGAFLGMRNFLGGGLGILAGILIIQPLLGGNNLSFNYVILACIGTALIAVDMSTWCMCREEPGERAGERSSLKESISRGLQWLKEDRNYRLYLCQRVAFRFTYLGLAFFIPYGSQKLGYEPDAGGVAVLGGLMVAVMKFSRVLAAVIWGKVADIYGNKPTLAGSAVCQVAAPALALSAPALPQLFSVGLPWTGTTLTLPLLVYLCALASIGFGFQGVMLGGNRFLITNAPPKRRASYVAFLNTTTSPLTLMPFAAAWLSRTAGMTTLFVIVLLSAVFMLVSALRMSPVSTGPEQSNQHGKS